MRPWTTGRRSSGGAVTYDCHVCRQPYERPDLAACATHDAVGGIIASKAPLNC